jgi:hypothetical protein
MMPTKLLFPALLLLSLAGCAQPGPSQAIAEDSYNPQDFSCQGFGAAEYQSLACSPEENTDPGRDWVRGHHH